MTDKKFIHIEIDHLQDKTLFPFHIYIFNPINSEYSPYLYANSPLSEEKKELLEYILERNGVLAVDIKQKRTFLKDSDLTEQELNLNQDKEEERYHNHPMVKNRKKHLELCEENELGLHHFKELFHQAINNDDFSELIVQIYNEIQTFKVTTSPTVSLAIDLTKKLLITDNFTNRVVVFSYLFAKICQISDEEELSNLICAAFLHHIGEGQLDYSRINAPQVNLTETEENDYKKHAGLSIHLIKKSQLVISSKVLEIITDHHERADGRGYPNEKKEKFIDNLSLILGFASHIVEHNSGRQTENSTQLESIIKNIQTHNYTPRLEFEFGDNIYNNIEYLLKFRSEETDKFDETSKAA